MVCSEPWAVRVSAAARARAGQPAPARSAIARMCRQLSARRPNRLPGISGSASRRARSWSRAQRATAATVPVKLRRSSLTGSAVSPGAMRRISI